MHLHCAVLRGLFLCVLVFGSGGLSGLVQLDITDNTADRQCKQCHGNKVDQRNKVTPAEHSGLKVVAQRGGIADTLGIVTVGHTDVQIHIQCLLCSAAQGLQIAVGAGLKGHLAADEASHPQAAACAQAWSPFI